MEYRLKKVRRDTGSRRRPMLALGAIVASGLAAAAAPVACAATYSARETHGGLLIERADGTTSRLGANGWFRRPE